MSGGFASAGVIRQPGFVVKWTCQSVHGETMLYLAISYQCACNNNNTDGEELSVPLGNGLAPQFETSLCVSFRVIALQLCAITAVGKPVGQQTEVEQDMRQLGRNVLR